MARVRSIHPQGPIDGDVAGMSLAARYVWAYLPCHADREGRLKDDAFTLKAAIMPADDVDMEAVLDELAARRHIARYVVEGKRYIQIRSFVRYQSPHPKEQPSVIPPMTAGAPSGGAGTVDAVARAGPRPPILLPGLQSRTRTTTLPGIPDPDPIRSDPDPGRVRRAIGQWSGLEWFGKFREAWCKAKGEKSYGKGPQDVRAVHNLEALIADIGADGALAAQARAGAMFATFLAEGGQAELAGHPFSFFVARFNGYRVTARRPPQTRPGGEYEPPPLPPPGRPPK